MWQPSAPVKALKLPLPHLTLAAQCWGAEDKPLLLALHGWLDNSNSFAPLAEKLMNDYRILAIDWPGHGLSDHRPGRYPLHWIDYLYDLELLLGSLADDAPVTLLGHSLGGIVASAYAAAFPERVDKLLLIEAFAPLYEAVEQAKPRLRKSFAAHKRMLGSKRSQVVYDSIEPAIKARVQLTGLAEPWSRLLVTRNMQIDAYGARWRSDPRLRLDSPMRLCFEQVASLMQGIAIPSLLITGEQGFPGLVQSLPQARAWYSELQVVQLQGDHHLHMENADEVAQTLAGFLQGRKSNPGD